jgi:hypothetical protein
MNPTIDPSSFGNIALEWGWLTMDDLQSALLLQEQRRPIGAILVELGKLDDMQVEEILAEQQRRKASNDDEVAMVELGHQRRLVQILSHGMADLTMITAGVTATLSAMLKK